MLENKYQLNKYTSTGMMQTYDCFLSCIANLFHFGTNERTIANSCPAHMLYIVVHDFESDLDPTILYT